MESYENYTLTISYFPRLLGLIYFFAFSALLVQMKGLFGEKGILPVKEYLEFIKKRLGKSGYWRVPSCFWINASDSTLIFVAALGTLASIGLVFGFSPLILLPLCFILYMSIMSVGQDFLSFGWEPLLLEITYFAFLLNCSPSPNIFIWIAVNLMIFRFHFLAGVIKWQAQDPAWRDWRALEYHYHTQPIPNTQAFFADKLPTLIQRLSTGAVFVLEVLVPFGIFGNDEVRFATFIGLLLLQVTIWFTGNFSFLNHMTAVLVTLLVSNQFLFGTPPPLQPTPWVLEIPLSIIGLILIALQVIRVLYHIVPTKLFEKILNLVWPFYLAHWHAIFAHMTKQRVEIIIEASLDGQVWEEYLFYFKPSELDRRPRRCSPFQPRLDWMVWFLPFSSFHQNNWFQLFLKRLLEGEPQVLNLLRYVPFEGKPPKYVRALSYLYEYTAIDELKKTGHWWKRRLLGPYSPTLSLDSFGS